MLVRLLAYHLLLYGSQNPSHEFSVPSHYEPARLKTKRKHISDPCRGVLRLINIDPKCQFPQKLLMNIANLHTAWMKRPNGHALTETVSKKSKCPCQRSGVAVWVILMMNSSPGDLKTHTHVHHRHTDAVFRLWWLEHDLLFVGNRGHSVIWQKKNHLQQDCPVCSTRPLVRLHKPILSYSSIIMRLVG